MGRRIAMFFALSRHCDAGLGPPKYSDVGETLAYQRRVQFERSVGAHRAMRCLHRIGVPSLTKHKKTPIKISVLFGASAWDAVSQCFSRFRAIAMRDSAPRNIATLARHSLINVASNSKEVSAHIVRCDACIA